MIPMVLNRSGQIDDSHDLVLNRLRASSDFYTNRVCYFPFGYILDCGAL